MVITRHFILLNFPKTGSTYARAVVREAYRRRYGRGWRSLVFRRQWRRIFQERMLPNRNDPFYARLRGPHAGYTQIPARYAALPIISITRNPLDRYLSRYLFGWWRKYPVERVPLLRERFPRYPDLSFPEYLEMLNTFGVERRLRGITLRMALGHHTVQFVQFYFRDPDTALAHLDDAYLAEERFRQDMVPVRFLRQETLREDLYRFLCEVGFSAEDLAFMEDDERVNASAARKPVHTVEKMYTREMVRDLLRRDALLFTLFSDYKDAALRLLKTWWLGVPLQILMEVMP